MSSISRFRKNRFLQVAAALLLVASLVVPGAASVSATLPTATVSIVAPAGAVAEGQQTTVQVTVASAPNMYAAEFHLKYDKTKLQPVDADSNAANGTQIALGSLISSRPAGSYYVAQNLTNLTTDLTGTIDFAVTAVNPAPPLTSDVTTSGVLASITFNAIALGTASITFENVHAPGQPAVNLADVNIQPIAVNLVPGQVQIVHYETPVPLFTASPVSGSAPLTVHFTDQSSGGITAWAWDFGDPTSGANNTSTVQNPTHIYSAAGSYSVKLKVSNPLAPAGVELLKASYITAYETPVAQFTAAPTGGSAPLTVHFTDQSTGGITAWLWDFGDPASGANNTSTVQNPTHVYQSAGPYSVKLKVSNPLAPAGVELLKQSYITAYDVPVALFTASPVSGYAPLTVKFTDQSTGGITAWQWDFNNDGTYDSNVQNPTYIYTSAGTYSVKLRVTNPLSSAELLKASYITAQQALEVAAGTAYLTRDMTTTIPISVRRWTDPTGLAVWGVRIDYNKAVVRVDDAVGVGAFDPLFTVNIQQESGFVMLVGTHSLSSGPKGDPITVARLYVTGLGDPGATTALDVTVIDDEVAAVSGTAFFATGVDGRVTMWKPDFVAAPLVGAAPLTVKFTDTSNGTPDSWAWEFGDGGTSTAQNPTHPYSSGGSFTVKLTTGWGATKMTETKTGYIKVILADFTATTATSGTSPLTVSFSDTSQGLVTAWQWNFGDPTSGTSNTSTLRNPSHTYSATGSYNVTLTASNSALGISDEEVKAGFVNVVNIVAETELKQYKDTDKVIALNVNIKGLKNPTTQEAVEMTSGLGAFDVTASFDANGIQMLDIRGVTPFIGEPNLIVNLSPDGRNDQAKVLGLQTGSVPKPPRTVTRLVPILKGDALHSYQLSVSFSEIAAVDGTRAPEAAPATMTFLRGDANGDGKVTITDALFIAQHVANLRLLPDLPNALNGASVRHDSTETIKGDMITIMDALFIAQYKALLKNADYTPK